MQLIREAFYEIESEEVLNEAAQKKSLYIKGIFAQAEVKNGNGRYYPLPVMENAVAKYQTDFIDKGCSWGQLDHPESPTVSLEKASHRIVEMKQDGKNFYGKAVIVEGQFGNQIKALMACGGKLAVSTRGLGTLVEDSNLGKVVQGDFMLCTTDIVSNPSAPNAFVNGILEGVEWIYENGIFTSREVSEAKKVIEKPVKTIDEQKFLRDFEKYFWEEAGKGNLKY